MIGKSPFTLDRFENERSHLYFLPAHIFSVLEHAKPTFMVGSRGTGKTTLLNALRWEEQLDNPDLRHLVLRNDGLPAYLGLYLRVPLYESASLDRWLNRLHEEVRGVFFALWLDLIWTHELLKSIADLLARRLILAPIQKEHALVREILDQYPELTEGLDGKRPQSVKKLAAWLYVKRVALEKAALVGGHTDVTQLTRLYPVTATVGDFGRFVANVVHSFCRAQSNVGPEWHFKICLDEAECLSQYQQLVINTLVRLRESPVSYVISYVRQMNDFTTTLGPLTLQAADRDILRLDTMGDDEFQDLAEGVAGVRIAKFMEFVGPLSTENIAGNLNINELLVGILRSSEDPKAAKWLRAAEQLQDEIHAKDAANSSPPPIYQAYLLDKLDLRLSRTEGKERRLQESATLRKKMVAAYLCICKELDQQVRYASCEMILQMSDKCVRDYLAQIDSLFQEIKMPIQEFIKTKIPILKQDSALKAASGRKRAFLPTSGVSSPTPTLILVEALAQLTARLQSSPTAKSTLRSPERGVFVIERQVADVDARELFRLIQDAAEAGYLKIVDETGSELRYRVHCSLAAEFEFSYRGAYYDVPLGIKELLALCNEADAENRKNRLKQLGDALTGDRGIQSAIWDKQ